MFLKRALKGTFYIGAVPLTLGTGFTLYNYESARSDPK